MNPLELKVKLLEEKVNRLTTLFEQFKNISQLDPQIIKTIQKATGAITLEDLANVSITAPSNGEVLEYSSGTWVNATDNT